MSLPNYSSRLHSLTTSRDHLARRASLGGVDCLSETSAWFLHGLPDQLVISQPEPSTSLRCRTGRLALPLTECRETLAGSSKSPPFYCLIITILSPSLLASWHISWGAARLGKNKKRGRAAWRKRACHYDPLYFLWIIRRAQPEKKAGTFCSLHVQLQHPTLKSLPSLSECLSSSKHTVYHRLPFMLFCLLSLMSTSFF